MGSNYDHDEQNQWDRVAAELRACRETQQKAYGDIDSATLGRFLAGECSPEESVRVEAAMNQLPELRALADLVQDVLKEAGPPVVETATAPQREVLPFKVAPGRKAGGFWHRRSPYLAAACLLVAVGLGSLSMTGYTPPSNPDAPRMENAVASRGIDEKLLAHLDLGPGLSIGDLEMEQDAPPLRGGDGFGAKLFAPAQDPPMPRMLFAKQGKMRDIAITYQAAVLAPPQGDQVTGSLEHLRLPAEIDEGPMSLARKEVVRPLARAMRYSPDRSRHIASALEQLGPASAEAMSMLVNRLVVSNDPRERYAIQQALWTIGPIARDALPRLQEFASTQPTSRSPLTELVKSLEKDRRWRVGVYDPAGRTSVRVARRANMVFRLLADKRAEVLVEVRHPSVCGIPKAPEDRLKEMGERAAVVIIDLENNRAECHFSEALKQHLSPHKTADLITAALDKGGCDEAVSAAQAAFTAPPQK